MAKLSKSSVLDKEAESETQRQLDHLHDTSRYTHFATGTNVTMSNVTYEVIDRHNDALLLRSPEGIDDWFHPYALARF